MQTSSTFTRKRLLPGLCLLILILLTTRSWAQPVITSFSPLSGPIGTSVTISGSNFSTTAANNIVFFGAVKANVTAATASSLTVTAPAGATFQPLSVTVNGLTGFAAKCFIITFPGSSPITQNPDFSQNCFAQKIDSSTDLHPNNAVIMDFDGDGKPDVATPNNYSTAGQPASVSVLRNTGSGGAISFALRQDIQTGVLTYSMAAGDLNGDGKPEMISGSVVDHTISVFQNTSSPGTISFAPKVDYAIDNSPDAISVADIDGDGRPDLVVLNSSLTSTNYFTVFRNTSTGGVISFAPRVDVTSPYVMNSLATGDLDGDGKPDVVTANYLFNNISAFRNTSTPGSISFAVKVDFAAGNSCDDVAIGDLDNDGKNDVVAVNSGSNNVSVYRNTSTIGSVTFAPKVDYSSGANPTSVSIGDLNGDAKPELVVPSANLGVYQNNSTVGSILFSTIVYLGLSPNANRAGISDLTADGKADLAASLFSSSGVSFLRNKNNEPNIIFFTPTTAGTGATVTINGVNFSAATAVSFGGIAASSFTITNATTINAVVGTGVSGSVAVTNQYGTSSLAGFVFAGPPVITSFTPGSAGIGVTVTINGNNLTGATAVSFGGIAATSFTVTSPTSIDAVVGPGASGSVSVTTPYGTASLPGFILIPPPTVTSFTPTSAISGATVTITGTGFTGTTGVKFGGVNAASFTVVSPTSVTAVVGAGASGSVTVTTNGGTASLTGFTFLPPPVITSFSPVNGSTGSQVVINGNNFSNVSSVKFGGVNAATFNFISPTKIIAQVGAGASGSISVTTPYGTGSANGFTYVAPISVSSFTPTAGGTGTTVTITGSNFANISSVSFGGVPASSFTVVSPTSITAVVAGGASGSVTVNAATSSASASGFVFNGPPVVNSFIPTNGGSGTVITITGNNFTGVSAVSIGGTPATSFTVINPSTITAVVGAGASGNVSVTNGFGAGQLAAFNYSSVIPVISSFAPLSGAIGTSITIQGANFNPVATDNIIYFGAVKAIPYAGNANTLQVAVPSGATYQPLSVTVNGLTAYSPVSFLPVFDGAPGFFGPSSFGLRKDKVSGNYPDFVAAGDFSLDGKPDIVVSHHANNSAKAGIHRNISTTGNFDFLTSVGLYDVSADPFGVVAADFDGDGLLDFSTANEDVNTVSVMRNRTPEGGASINFDNKVELSTGTRPQSIAAADFDKDGRIDLVVTNYNSNTISIFRNLSTPGNILFAAKIDLAANVNPTCVAAGDLDGDGKMDLAVSNYGTAALSVYKNNSTPGTISFGVKTDLPALVAGTFVAIGDLDGDNRNDLVLTTYFTLTVSTFRNTGGNGILSFAARNDIANGDAGSVVIFSDLDGDKKPDLVVGNAQSSTFGIYKNMSLPGFIELYPRQVYASEYNVNGIAACDFDGDGSTDLVTTNGNVPDVSLFRSTAPVTSVPPPTIISFTPVTGSTGTVVTITGTNFNGAYSVTIGGIPVTTFTIVSPTTISCTVGAGASGAVSVTTLSGTASLAGFTYVQPPGPAITSFTPTSGKTGDVIIIRGTNLGGATSVSFGGTTAASFNVISSTMIVALVGGGSSGSVSVTTPSGTASLAGFTYNVVTAVGGPNSNNSTELTVSPNPGNDHIVIKHPAVNKASSIRIIDMLGRTMIEVSPARNSKETTVNVNGLAAGTYKITWSDGRRILVRTFMVKQ